MASIWTWRLFDAGGGGGGVCGGVEQVNVAM